MSNILAGGCFIPRRVINESGHAHELTFSTYQNRPTLLGPGAAEEVIKALGTAASEFEFDVWAYVVMPTHCHLLVYPRKDIYDVSAILMAIKLKSASGIFARHPKLREEALVVRENGRREHRFWLRGGGYDRNICTGSEAWTCINYIHANPCTARLCDREVDWPWSSALAFQSGETPEWLKVCPWVVS